MRIPFSLLLMQVPSFSQATPSTLVARDSMASPVTTLPLTASPAQAWELVKSTRFRHIPIYSPEGELVGMLSDRDLSQGPKAHLEMGLDNLLHRRGGTMLEQGEKLLIVYRRLFEKDTPRFCVGEVQAYEQGLVKVKGYTFVKDLFTGSMKKKSDLRTKVMSTSQAPSLCINCRLPFSWIR